MYTISEAVSDYLDHCTREMLVEIIEHGIHNLTNEFSYDLDCYDYFLQEFDKQAKSRLAAINKINEIVYYSESFSAAYSAIVNQSQYIDELSDKTAGLEQYEMGGYKFMVNTEKERIDGQQFQQEESTK